MPTYEYRCKECGEHLEAVQSFTDDALTDCPACGAAGQLRKVFGNIGITFKGSGFYRTDSRTGSKPSTSTKKDDSGSSSSDTKSDSKSETKSDTKSETKSESSKSDSSSSSTSAA